MCGIVGIFGFGGDLTGQQNTLELMANSLHHRGPDEKGSYFSDNIALGFRRLSIIDIANGQQPVLSNDRTVVSICNGELYNHDELRRELQQLGHQFSNRSDTELIPALYQSFGDNFARKINGQFAFAVYDLKKNRLFLKKIPFFSAKHIEVKHISGIGLHDELSISGIPPKARCLTVNNDCTMVEYSMWL